MKVVLDTSVLLQAIAYRSRLRPIWNGFLSEAFELHLNTSILLEYEELLLQKTSETATALVIALIEKAPNAYFRSVHYEWNAIAADPDDNKFFDVAVAAGADYLVTNDAHFNEVKKRSFPHVNIITADAFLKVLP